MMDFDFNWLGAADSGDVVERQTWAQLALRVGALTPTRAYDRAAKSEREAIFIPLYPLARWVVDQWWPMLYEPWPFQGRLPEPGVVGGAEERAWLGRHCLRVASPGFAAPFACVFSQGSVVAVSTRADPRDRYTHTPVEFRDSGDYVGEREDVRISLSRFVTGVVERLDGVVDPRAAALRLDWQAICSVSTSEAEFCRAAGCLGLDPYTADVWPTGVLEWLEGSPDGTFEARLTTDLLETPDFAGIKPGQWTQLQKVIASLELSARASKSIPPALTAFNEGYELARALRDQLGLADGSPLNDVREASEVACDRAMVFETSAALPDGRVLGLVGWRPNRVPVVAARRSDRRPERFLAARALYFALRGTSDGPRLLTDARTWDQRASRAFGAELLAPRAGVRALLAEQEARFGREEAELRIAEHYAVSPMQIRHQYDNSANDEYYHISHGRTGGR